MKYIMVSLFLFGQIVSWLCLNSKEIKRVQYYMGSESREPEIVNEQNNLHRRNAYSLKKNLQDKKIGRSKLF